MAGEFKGDFTRDTFFAFRHYCSVFQQQGRVSLDADGNEQASILLSLLRSVSRDVIADGDDPVGDQFQVLPLNVPPGTTTERDFVVTPGHVYVDGVLCVLNGSKIPFTIPKDGKGSQVNVSQWFVDGIPYLANQYVRAVRVNPDGSPDTVFNQASIQKAEAASRSLTFNAPLTPSGSPNGFRLVRLPTFLHQPDYVPAAEELAALKDLNADGALLVYLDAWERHVSYVQNPWIREVALGGPDTCVRSQLVPQIKIAYDLGLSNSDMEQEDLPIVKGVLENHYQPYNRGWLRARLKPVDPGNTDPCMCHPDARFRGSENQLYRVEIHLPGQATPAGSTTTINTIGDLRGPAVAAPAASSTSASGATFKWSRNNGCDVYPVLTVSGTDVQVDSIGRDARSHLKSGDWVELLDDILILQGRPGPLLQVSDVSGQDRRVTLVSSSPYNVVAKDPAHPRAFLRRWDEKDLAATGGVSFGLPIVESISATDDWYDLEDGIQIQFVPALSPMVADEPLGDTFSAPINAYRTGDYWLIPARVALQGSIEWLATNDSPSVPIALPPHGIDHHYLPLGVIELGTGGQSISTLRNFTAPLNKIA
jgi:hypothetical protein